MLLLVSLQSLNQPRKFYRIAALSMIAVGSALLLLSASNIMTRQAMCQDNLDVGNGRTDILTESSSRCIDPMFEIAPSSNDFILIILAICLLAFSGAILGIITRL